MNKELIELISNNPDLPIYAWVDCDVVQDDCHRWVGRINGNGEIKEYVELDYSYSHMADCEWLFKDDTEDWEEYMYENYMEEDMSEEEAEKKIKEELNNMKWKKAIFVYNVNREIKPMIYSHLKKREILDSGKCCNYNYYILNLGAFPTAYIEIPTNHKLYSKIYENIDIDVHGGLTYSESYLWIDDKTELKDSWFIGWDYAHFGDYLGYEEMYPIEMQTEGKKWTTEEIQKEVIKVCEQLERLKYEG